MLVIESKIVDYTYFMDTIQEYEIVMLNGMIPWASKQSMEETRLLMYTFCSPYMKQKKKITDWLPLYTDHKESVECLEGEELDNVRNIITNIFSKQK